MGRLDQFFDFIFSGCEGFVCVAYKSAVDPSLPFMEEYFEAHEVGKIVATCNNVAPLSNVWFCPQTFTRRKRMKEYVLQTPCAWADLDDCDPNKIVVPPSMSILTSPGRYQGYWRFMTNDIEPNVAEDISKRIAYFHKVDGADTSGWDITQLLRVPFTKNHKYADQGLPPTIIIPSAIGIKYKPGAFDVFPQVGDTTYLSVPFPETLPSEDADDILHKYRHELHPHVFHLYGIEPTKDWSKPLWQLQMLLFESGLNPEEVYVVAKAAKCNKYERDKRSDSLLWKEVCRAAVKHTEVSGLNEFEPTPDPILSDEERQWVVDHPGIVEEYIEWGKQLGDASWQYHQAGAFIVLSSLLSGPVRLPTSFGTIVPNMWFMILADTTLTRKSTAMDLAVDLITDIDPDAILATDGSIEGLFTSLSTRPGRPSIFLRDEFSGLLDSITHKEYYAGMAEMLTKLYDGKYQKRVLRKEVIEVREPVLILFAGGIKSRILDLLNHEHATSGFIPRFCFITAESDISKLRPLGPPTDQSIIQRQALITKLQKAYSHYRRVVNVEVGGKVIVSDKVWEARLTSDAWTRYNRVEADLLQGGLSSMHKDVMTPTMDRLAKSGLKAAVLLAAIRNLGDTVVVEEQDIVRAFWYIEQWRTYTMEVINNIGKSASEKLIDQVARLVERQPGVQRSHVMRSYHLNRRDTDLVFDTLEQRNIITRQRSGKGERLYPVERTSG